VALKVF
jgi:hypothetical protein